MNLRLPSLVGVVMLGLAFTALAGGDNAAKLVGVWEVTKSEAMPPGARLEFFKDGKLKLSAKFGEKAVAVEGTYKLKDKDTKIDVVLNYNGKTKDDSLTIKKLTATELHLQDDKGLVAEYKRGK